MTAACRRRARLACALALGVALLAAVATTAAQTASPTSPASIGLLAEQVLALFPKLDGDVIEAQGSTVTLSLGRKDGLVQGIELALYREGRELRHPRTGQVLGRTEQGLGRALVEEVFESYAVARVTQGGDVRPGDRARISAGRLRLTVLPLVDGVKDAVAEPAVQELVEALNRTGRFQIAMGDAIGLTLTQQGVSPADIVEGKGLADIAERYKVERLLVVRFSAVQRKPYMDVRLFTLPGPTRLLSTAMFVPASVKPVVRGEYSGAGQNRPSQTAVPQRSLLARLLSGDLDAGTYSAGEGSIPLKEVAKFPFVVTAMDVAVAPADRVARIVLSDGEKVFLYRLVDHALEPEWTWEAGITDVRAKVFGVQLADLDDDGRFEVVVNRYHPHPQVLVNAMVLGIANGRPTTLVKNVGQILLAVDPTGAGVKKVLWGQDFVQNGFFRKGHAERLVLRNGSLVPDGRVRVSDAFRATGATWATVAKETRALAFIDEHNRMRVTVEGEDVWRSSSPVGGAIVKLPVDVQIERSGRTYIYHVEPMPVAIDLDGDGIEEIVVPQNQVPGRLAVVYKGPAGYRFQSVNSGFEGVTSALGALPGDRPSLVAAVTRYYGLLTSTGDTQIIMTIPE
ncbi:MAG TPA: hypothetical protein VNN07_03350 [Candidatus Tectomicrobia bacterium]|nr:hypothetical protein [Candidatus Tectomicrobia bacterium]